MSTPLRAIPIALALTAALAVGASSASALTINEANNLTSKYIDYNATDDVVSDVVDHVTVSFDAGGAGTADDVYDFAQSVATSDKVLDPTSGCKLLSKHEATCPAAGVHLIEVSLGKGSDSLFATGVSVPMQVSGDEGSDTIFTGSGNDWVSDGSGPTSVSESDGYYTGGGNDTLAIGGRGPDAANGGPGTDTVDGEAHPVTGVTASLDGLANDGGGGLTNVVQVENM